MGRVMIRRVWLSRRYGCGIIGREHSGGTSGTSDCWCVEQPRHDSLGKTGIQERCSVVCQLEFVIRPRFRFRLG